MKENISEENTTNCRFIRQIIRQIKYIFNQLINNVFLLHSLFNIYGIFIIIAYKFFTHGFPVSKMMHTKNVLCYRNSWVVYYILIV